MASPPSSPSMKNSLADLQPIASDDDSNPSLKLSPLGQANIDNKQISKLVLDEPIGSMTNSPWIKLSGAPYKYISTLAVLNQTDLIFAPTKRDGFPASEGIVKYNQKTNEWKLFIKYPDDFDTITATLIFCEKTNKLHILDFAGYYTVDIANQTFNRDIIKINKDYGNMPPLILMNDTPHIIGKNKHIIWNDNKKIFEDNFIFPYNYNYDGDSFNDYKRPLIYIRSKKECLLFGDDIWLYSLINNKWNKLDIKWYKKLNLNEMESVQYILSSNEKYVLLFGGRTYEEDDDSPPGIYFTYYKNIFIVNIDNMKIKKAPYPYKCPQKGIFYGAKMLYTDQEESNMVIMGYIRMYKQTVKLLSNDIVNIITLFYAETYIHLIWMEKNYGYTKQEHWKIAESSILNSVSW